MLFTTFNLTESEKDREHVTLKSHSSDKETDGEEKLEDGEGVMCFLASAQTVCSKIKRQESFPK